MPDPTASDAPPVRFERTARADARPVTARFDLPSSSSDGGAVLLDACDARFGPEGLCARLAACLSDRRDPARVQHSVLDLLRQRLFGLCAGYRDCNDAARLKADPVARLVLGRDPIDGPAPASQPTLCRFENALDARSLVRMGHALADTVIARHRRRLRRRPPKRITLDVDPTDDHTHGAQQLSVYNGHYGAWCYLTVPVFVSFGAESEAYLVGATLRPGDAHASDGAVTILSRLVEKLRAAFPRTTLRVRLDGGFAVPELFEFLEEKGLEYVVAIGGSTVLRDRAEASMRAVRRRSSASGLTEHDYGDCEHTSEGWNGAVRRVVIKAEVVRLEGRKARDNPRFVVTNLTASARHVYEGVYCARGEIENRIKELVDGLGLDRTSCTRFLANQARVLFVCAAYVLMQELRLSARDTDLARAQVTTLRERLIKVAVRVEATARRVVLHLADSAPWRRDWCQVARRLGAVLAGPALGVQLGS